MQLLLVTFFALALSSVPLTVWAQCTTESDTNSTTGLFDNSSGDRTFTITSSGDISDVYIDVEFWKCDGETFATCGAGLPFHDETVLTLVSPAGTSVSLIAEFSFDAGSVAFQGTIAFNQSASQVVNVDLDLPQAGTFRPVGDLDAFSGEGAGGTWTLIVEDTWNGDALQFVQATLRVTTTGTCFWRITDNGTIYKYTEANFVSDGSPTALLGIVSGMGDDAGFFELDGEFWRITDTGGIFTYSSQADFVTATNAVNRGTVSEYGDDAGFFAILFLPEPHPTLLLVSGIGGLIVLHRIRRRRVR